MFFPILSHPGFLVHLHLGEGEEEGVQRVLQDFWPLRMRGACFWTQVVLQELEVYVALPWTLKAVEEEGERRG